MADKRAEIDWAEAKRRLRESEQALEAALTVSPERLEEVYRQRAAELARGTMTEQAAEPALRVLTFLLGTERYALDLADVVEVLPLPNVTPVPEGPPALVGVMNIHEEIRSLVDLGVLMELAERNSPQSGYVIVVRRGGRQATLRVDAVDSIGPLRPEELVEPESRDGKSGCRYVRSVTPQKVQLLATETILAHPLFGNA